MIEAFQRMKEAETVLTEEMSAALDDQIEREQAAFERMDPVQHG